MSKSPVYSGLFVFSMVIEMDLYFMKYGRYILREIK
jgi:hypothetical protein